jgi:hypothetical protein
MQAFSIALITEELASCAGVMHDALSLRQPDRRCWQSRYGVPLLLFVCSHCSKVLCYFETTVECRFSFNLKSVLWVVSGCVSDNIMGYAIDILGAAILFVKRPMYTTLNCEKMCVLSLSKVPVVGSNYWNKGQSLYLENTRLISTDDLRSRFQLKYSPFDYKPTEPIDVPSQSKYEPTERGFGMDVSSSIESNISILLCSLMLLLIFHNYACNVHWVHQKTRNNSKQTEAKRTKKKKKKQGNLIKVDQDTVLQQKSLAVETIESECSHVQNVKVLPCTIPLSKFQYICDPTENIDEELRINGF